MNDTLPSNIAELIDRLGGTGFVAGYLSAPGDRMPAGRVSAWKARNRLPSAYWGDIVALAKEKRIRGVSFELIAGLHSRAERLSA